MSERRHPAWQPARPCWRMVTALGPSRCMAPAPHRYYGAASSERENTRIQRAAAGHWARGVPSHVPRARHSRMPQGMAAGHSRGPRMRHAAAAPSATCCMAPCGHVNATAGSSAAASSAALAVRLVTPPV